LAIGYWEHVTCDATPAGVARSRDAAFTLVGIGNVAPGSDYDGSVEARFDSSEPAALTQALLDLNLTDAEIRAVMGGNMMRFLANNLPPG
jgi:membrane dipeptidase